MIYMLTALCKHLCHVYTHNMYSNIHVAIVTVNGTIGGTRDNPVKFNVKEDAGKIVLCYSITIPENKVFMSGKCQTIDETAGKLYNNLIIVIFDLLFVVAGTDYDPVNASYSVPRQETTLCEHITIKDNPYHDGNRKFIFRVSGEYGVDVWVEICIWDDEWGML